MNINNILLNLLGVGVFFILFTVFKLGMFYSFIIDVVVIICLTILFKKIKLIK